MKLFLKIMILFMFTNVILLGCANPMIENTLGVSNQFI